VYFVARADLVCLKLYAAAARSSREAQHRQDLVALKPTEAELEKARDWVLGLLSGERRHDEAEQLKDSLRRMLIDMEHGDLAYGW
jgi:hypothetical protein